MTLKELARSHDVKRAGYVLARDNSIKPLFECGNGYAYVIAAGELVAAPGGLQFRTMRAAILHSFQHGAPKATSTCTCSRTRAPHFHAAKGGA